MLWVLLLGGIAGPRVTVTQGWGATKPLPTALTGGLTLLAAVWGLLLLPLLLEPHSCPGDICPGWSREEDKDGLGRDRAWEQS